MPKVRWNGARQRELRLAARISPEALAVAVNRSADRIRAYERGSGHPPELVALRIADELGVDLSELWVIDAQP